MTKDEYNQLYKYLENNNSEVAKFFEKDNKGKYTGKFQITSECKLKLFNRIFDVNVSCTQYDAVVNGEGNEKEKIDSIYSSSLQSLLAFYGINNDNQIEIKGEKFNKVIFEYKNKVIKYPSSIDVVLMNDDSIAFIESKYLEIVRDSTGAARKVVGISYFGKNENGYNKLQLNEENLKTMKISYPDGGNPFLESVRGRSKEHQEIGKLDNNTFVYSEGIKQILSHIIGILSFVNNESEYSFGEDPIFDHKQYNKKIIYFELYNGFPDLEFTKKRLEDFKRHVDTVKNIINEKNLIKNFEFVVMTYQELFEKNKDFKISEKVSKYFRLK